MRMPRVESSQRRLILHIGTDKTGSTTLQRFCHANRRALGEQGILYPETPPPVDWKHEDLVVSLSNLPGSKRKLRPDTLSLEDLGDLIRHAPEDVILVSAEGLRTLSHQTAALQRIQAFAEHNHLDTEVVVFVRPQPGLFNSRYAQWVKSLRYSARFGPWLEESLRRGDPAMHYVAALGNWDRGPRMRLRPIPFARDALTPNLVVTFFRHLGLAERIAPLLEPASGEHFNASPGPKTIELCRRAAVVLRQAPGGRLDDQVTSRLRNALLRAGRQRQWDVTPFIGLDNAARDRLIDAFFEENQSFARRWWGRDWSEVFAAEERRDRSPNEYDPATADPDTEAALTDALARSFAAAGLDLEVRADATRLR